MTNDQHVDSLVDDYLHELLAPGEAGRVERHCTECAACRDALEAARTRLAALRALPPCEPSDELLRQTLLRLESAPVHDKDEAMKPSPAPNTPTRRRSPWHRRVWLSLSALAVVAAGVIGFVQSKYQKYEPSPYDLRILGQNQLLQGAPASFRLAVFDRSRNAFAGDVPLKVSLISRQTQAVLSEKEIKTIAGGPTSVSFEPPANALGEFDLKVVAATNQGPETLQQVVSIRRAVRLMLSCDKPVYQPGQTIHLRSLTLRKPDLKPVQGESATFSVVDPNGNVVFKQSLSTSTFGIAAADCQLATEIREGTYQLRCQVAEDVSERTVEVQKYVLPKFKVSVTLDKPFYQPQETLQGALEAAYFFGKPVAAGTVKLQLLTTDVENHVLDEQDAQTDDQGKLKFEFKLPDTLAGNEQAGGDATVRVAVQVTDSAGQSQATLATRTVTREVIHLDIIPEAGRIVPGIKNKLYVFATYPDGQPVKKAKITLKGQEQAVETSDLGVAMFELPAMQPNNTTAIEVSAEDEAGRTAGIAMTFATGTSTQDYLVRTDKPIYNAGETMHLEALGGGQEPVFVDLLKDGQSLLSQTIDVKDGRGELAIDLPAELTGVVELWSYRFAAAGVAERKSRLLLIKPAADLKITAALEQEEHRPGEKAKVNFQLADAAGKPTPGAISVAIVDEAVFSVLSQSAGLPQLFFRLDEELLKPVYAVYEQWSPLARDGVPEEVREEFDEAMFCLTTRIASGADGALQLFNQGQPSGQQADGGFGGDPMMVPMMIDAPMGAEPAMDFAPGIKPPDFLPGAMPLATPFNLTAATYRGKEMLVAKEREDGLKKTRLAWGGLIVSVCLGSVVALAIYAPRVFLWGAAGLGILSVLAVGSGFVLFVFMGAEKFETLAKGAAMPMAEAMDMAMPPMAMPMEMMMEGAGGIGMTGSGSQGLEPIRVRKDFPETLLWLPELVTDDSGKVALDIDLADSITTWRLSAAAVSGQGQLGSGEFPIRVFQPFFVDFNLPVALTRGDEAAIPVVVYNYLEAPQTVTLNLAQASWYERMTDDPNAELRIELQPREIKSLSVRLKVLEVGRQKLEVKARGGNIADAIVREIEVVPNGRRVDESYAGRIEGRIDHPLELPAHRIAGSPRLIAKIYPATFTQLVEGLDSMFKMPYGCFEQTSSTTYPSVLALDYLKWQKKASPAVEAKARQYIHIGYQRLISFEVNDPQNGLGGFDWFGNPPANRTLTAYGLMEFDDMARVHEVDPNLIDRTRWWLLNQRKPDGSWAAEPHMLDDGLAGSVNRGGDAATLASTAYIGWAVFRGGKFSEQTGPTLAFLTKYDADKLEDPYVLAIAANAIAAIQPEHPSLTSFCDRLEALKKRDEGKKHTWWEKPGQTETMFHGNGESSLVETTAMAALALMAAKRHAGSVSEALTWITTKKAEGGNWGSTQATVLALQALLGGMDKAAAAKERRIELAINGERVQELVIAPDQFDVVQQVDLTKYLPAAKGTGESGEGSEGAEPDRVTVSLSGQTEDAPAYQLALWYHVPGEPEMQRPEPLTIKLAYDREQLKVNDHIAATATVTNNLERSAPMVILDLPVPGGFAMEPGELDELVGSKTIEKYQITPRKAIVYLRDLPPGGNLELKYRLKATMPVKVSVPKAETYLYYTPESRGREKEERVFVVGDA